MTQRDLPAKRAVNVADLAIAADAFMVAVDALAERDPVRSRGQCLSMALAFLAREMPNDAARLGIRLSAEVIRAGS